MARTSIPSICRFCHANCGILVEVEATGPLRVTGDRANPAYHGYTCAKGRQLPRCTRIPDRLLTPQKRVAPGPLRADRERAARSTRSPRKVSALIAEHGPRSVAIYVRHLLRARTLRRSRSRSAGCSRAGSRMMFTARDDRPARQEHRQRAALDAGSAARDVFDESDAWLLARQQPARSRSRAASRPRTQAPAAARERARHEVRQ